MNDAGDAVYMGDEAKRHRIAPLVVGSLNAHGWPSGEHPPVAMMLIIDVDAVPGFREILVRQRNGEEFDISSRWASAVDKKGKRPPELVLDFYLPEVDLGIAIHIDVDRHPDSIGAAIRTDRVVVIDPETSLRLQREPFDNGALEDLRLFTVQPPDPSPAIGVLQQRFDFPRQTQVTQRRELTGQEELERFFAGGRTPASIGVQMRGDGLSVIAMIDSDLDSVKEKVPDGASVEGAWAAITAGELSVIAFDLVVDGEPLARWLICDPAEDILLAGSHGAHWVMLANEPTGPSGAELWWSSAIHVLVKQVEALRAVYAERTGGANSGS
jgi:hypothetical protein